MIWIPLLLVTSWSVRSWLLYNKWLHLKPLVRMVCPLFLPKFLEYSGQGCYPSYFVIAEYEYPTSFHKSCLYYTQPKTNNLEYVHRFHPISLCNVLYKIFYKVLANRLKNLLPTIIIETQLAFTKDRLISGNILVAFETLHCMHKYNSGTSGFVALKLDMSKAYDQVKWSFLENLMRKWVSMREMDQFDYDLCEDSYLFHFG